MQIRKNGKTDIWAAGFVALLLLISVGIAAAHGFGRQASIENDVSDSSENGDAAVIGCMAGKGIQGMMSGRMCEHHEEMEKIIEDGSYEDLVKLRDETRMNMIPWVQNEQDFARAKEMHEKMEDMHEEMMAMHGKGMMGRGGGHSGCPMMG